MCNRISGGRAKNLLLLCVSRCPWSLWRSLFLFSWFWGALYCKTFQIRIWSNNLMQRVELWDRSSQREGNLLHFDRASIKNLKNKESQLLTADSYRKRKIYYRSFVLWIRMWAKQYLSSRPYFSYRKVAHQRDARDELQTSVNKAMRTSQGV